MTGSGCDALPGVIERSGGHPGCLRIVERPSRMSWSGQKALPDVRELLVDPPRCSETLPEVCRPSRMFGSCW